MGGGGDPIPPMPVIVHHDKQKLNFKLLWQVGESVCKPSGRTL